MRLSVLHPSGRDAPKAIRHVNFSPAYVQHFARAGPRVEEEADRFAEAQFLVQDRSDVPNLGGRQYPVARFLASSS